jgi:hypothetical protein
MTILTQQVACDWQWDRQIVRNAGTNVGGPAQVGPSRLVRFHGTAAPCSAIDLIIYVTAEDGGYRLNLLAVWSVFDAATLEVTWSGSRTWAAPAVTGELIIAGSEKVCDAHEMTSGHDGLAAVLGVFGDDVYAAVLGWDGQPFQDGEH